MVRNLYQSDISYLTMLSLIGSEGFVADDYMYYVFDEEKGLEGLDKICCEDDVQQMLAHSHNEKFLNIRVVGALEECNADENRDSYFAEHCINTQQSCTKVVDISMDRKEELKKSMVQREAELNHFEGDIDVSEFLSADAQSDSDDNNVELHPGSSSEE